MKKETVIHIPERGCHNCRLHCVNHKECDSDYPCKQGMEWRPIIQPIEPQEPEEVNMEDKSSIIWNKREQKQTEEKPDIRKFIAYKFDIRNDKRKGTWKWKDVCQQNFGHLSITEIVEWMEEYAQNQTKEQVSTCVDCDKEKDTHSICAECLDKLIKQNQQPEISVTDEEIEAWAQNRIDTQEYHNEYEDNKWKKHLIQGAKAMRDGKILLNK